MGYKNDDVSSKPYFSIQTLYKSPNNFTQNNDLDVKFLVSSFLFFHFLSVLSCRKYNNSLLEIYFHYYESSKEFLFFFSDITKKYLEA